MAAIQVRLEKSDLPRNHVKPIRDAIQLLYGRTMKENSGVKNRNAQRAELAKSLKLSLDNSFGPHWHVLIGANPGFACKKRSESMGRWKVEENLIVMWKSPGIEELETPGTSSSDAAVGAGQLTSEGYTAGEKESNGDEAAEGSSDAKANGKKTAVALKGGSGAAVRVLEPQSLDEASGDEARVVAALREELATPEPDVQVLAQRLRRRLTADFGTIWHVVTGSDFVVEAAANRWNHVAVTASAGKVRVTCFQHEQKIGGVSIQWQKIFRTLPYLLLAIFCLAYMTMNSLCGDVAEHELSPWQLNLRNRLCKGDWESNMNYTAVSAVACLFAGRFIRQAPKIANRKKNN